MTSLLVFWTAVLVVALIGATLRTVLGDDPTRRQGYRPPASHPRDDFARRNSDHLL